MWSVQRQTDELGWLWESTLSRPGSYCAGSPAPGRWNVLETPSAPVQSTGAPGHPGACTPLPQLTHRHPVLDWSGSRSVSMPLGSVATTAHFLGIHWAWGAVRGRAGLLPMLLALSWRDRKPCFPEGLWWSGSLPCPLDSQFLKPHPCCSLCWGRVQALCQPDPAVSHTCWPRGLPRDTVLGPP